MLNSGRPCTNMEIGGAPRLDTSGQSDVLVKPDDQATNHKAK